MPTKSIIPVNIPDMAWLREKMDIANPFRYTADFEFDSTTGGSELSDFTTGDLPIWIQRHHVSVFAFQAGKAIAITKELKERDPMFISITRVSGDQIMDNPIDIFAFNEECNDVDYPGWILPERTKLNISISHEIITAANFGPTIRAYITFSGYHLKNI